MERQLIYNEVGEMITTAVILVWIAAGVLSLGIYIHNTKNRFGYFSPFPFGIGVLILGFPSLFATIITHEGRWGFSLKPYTREERWEIYRKEYPTLANREHFDRAY